MGSRLLSRTLAAKKTQRYTHTPIIGSVTINMVIILNSTAR